MKCDAKTERKLGSDILETVAEMNALTREDVARFVVLQRRLARRVKKYQEVTGRNKLNADTDYGYTFN